MRSLASDGRSALATTEVAAASVTNAINRRAEVFMVTAAEQQRSGVRGRNEQPNNLRAYGNWRDIPNISLLPLVRPRTCAPASFVVCLTSCGFLAPTTVSMSGEGYEVEEKAAQLTEMELLDAEKLDVMVASLNAQVRAVHWARLLQL